MHTPSKRLALLAVLGAAMAVIAVSPIIGKVPRTPGPLALHNGPRALRVSVRKTGAILADRQVPVPTSATVPSHSP